MKRPFALCLMLILVAHFGGLHAQEDSAKLVKFTPDFRFRDGIFLNFDQVRHNQPIPRSRLLTSKAFDDREFLEYLLKNKTILYYDAVGGRQTVRTNDLWGFSRNGVLYIRLEDNFNRITIVGRICHFVATVTNYDTRYYDPYYYSPYNYYNNRYGAYPSASSSSEMRQYMLDFDSGKVVDYSVQNLEILLMKDPELHDEYMQLRRKKKKQRKFLYLRKFNERNPLYIPVEGNNFNQ